MTIILSIQRKSSKFNMVLSIQSSKLTLISIKRKRIKLTILQIIQRNGSKFSNVLSIQKKRSILTFIPEYIGKE